MKKGRENKRLELMPEIIPFLQLRGQTAFIRNSWIYTHESRTQPGVINLTPSVHDHTGCSSRVKRKSATQHIVQGCTSIWAGELLKEFW